LFTSTKQTSCCDLHKEAAMLTTTAAVKLNIQHMW